MDVKALISSHFLYPFTLLPSPFIGMMQKIQSFLTDYVWGKGLHYINSTRICQPFDQGGFNMYSVFIQEKALKLHWISKFCSPSVEFWKVQLDNCFKVSFRTLILSNLSYKDFISLKKSSKRKSVPYIWLSVIRHWCGINFTVQLRNLSSMCLAFNSAFVNRKYSFNVSLMNLYEQNNIVTLQDFFHAWNTFSVEQKRTLNMTEIYESMPVSWQNQICP